MYIEEVNEENKRKLNTSVCILCFVAQVNSPQN